MRNATVAMLMALTLVTGRLGAETRMPPPADVGPGRVAWFDITTTSLPKSKEFYGKLFDWQFNTVEGTDLAVYIVSRGTAIGVVRVAEGAISGFDGVVYVQVTDITAACKKVTQLGGTVVPGFPFNLSDDRGAIAVFTDPAGHPLGLYSRTPLPPEPMPAPAAGK